MKPNVNSTSLRKIEDPRERYKSAMDEFSSARKDMSVFVSKTLKEKGIALKTVAETAGVDAGGLSRALQGNFSLPPRAVEKFCSLFFCCSCHELLFGEPGITHLPRNLAVIANKSEKMSKQKKNSLLSIVTNIYEHERRNNLLPTDIKPEQTIRHRIQEIAEDKYVVPMEILGEGVPAVVKVALKKYCTITDGDNGGYIGGLNSLMYYALELQTSVDYFICQDYTALTTLAYKKDGQIRIVTDKILIEFISKFLKLSSDGQVKALSEALNILWLD